MEERKKEKKRKENKQIIYYTILEFHLINEIILWSKIINILKCIQ